MNYFKTKFIIFLLFVTIIICRDIEYHDLQINIFDNPYPSNIFIHTMGASPRYMAILDTLINPSWYVNCGPMGLDFKPNQNKLSYFHKADQSWIIMNEFMVETDTLVCTNGYGADYHDILLLDDGGYILQAYDSITVDMSELVSGGNSNAKIIILIIQEFDQNKNLLIEWNAWDHLNIAEYTNLDLTSDRIEWLHGNSIDIDIDSNLIISNRRSSELLKIDRYNGQVIWYFGGPNNEFSITNDPLNGFSKQHDAQRIGNGNILLFDNGNEHNPPISRVVEYQLNETEKTADLVWDFSHPEELLGLAMGSVQRLPNNNTLINWGTIHHRGAVITEVDYDKNIVLDIEYPIETKCYKVRKYNWNFGTNLIPGDTNLDALVNIFDINYIIDYTFSPLSNLDMYHLFRFDLNRDGFIDENDISLIIEKLME
mgnify:CR=1 FL=1